LEGRSDVKRGQTAGGGDSGRKGKISQRRRVKTAEKMISN
jgi:hypothetical protein